MSLAYPKLWYNQARRSYTSHNSAPDHHGASLPLFSRLPNELIHRILNFSLASDLSGKTILSLCLVASWTRKLAFPYLFSTIMIIDDVTPLVMHGDSLQWNLRPVEGKQMVHNLWCTGGKNSVSVIMAFMRLCPGITNISVNGDDFCTILFKMINRHDDGDDFDDDFFRGQARELIFSGVSCAPREIHFHPNSDRSRFNRLMMRARQSRFRDWDGFAMNFLRRVTALFLPPVDYRFLDRFTKMLPCLTHLAVPYTSINFYQLSDLRPALHMSSLQMFVLAIATDKYTTYALSSAEHWVRMAREQSSKAYLLPYESDIYAVRTQWKTDARGGGSIWDRAVQYTENWEKVR
jgi:hypothetical protein